MFIHKTRITVRVGRVGVPQDDPLSSFSSYFEIYLLGSLLFTFFCLFFVIFVFAFAFVCFVVDTDSTKS